MTILKRVCCVLLAAALAGCQGTSAPAQQEQEAEPIEILICRWNNMDQNNAIMLDIIEDFQEQHQGEITLRMEVVPGLENLIDHVRIKIAAGEVPDIIDTSGYDLSYLVQDSEIIADLMPYVEADPELKRWIGEENLRDNVSNGKLTSITAQKNVIGYWYNKELFAQAGIRPAETWEEFWENCEILKAMGIWPMALDTRQSAWPTNILLGAIVGSDGGEGTRFMQSYHPTNFSFPSMVNGLENIRTCFQQYAPPSSITANYAIAESEFFSGNTAMFFNGAWLALDMSDPEKVPAEFQQQVGAAIYPGGVVYSSASPGYVVGDNGPERVAAAVEFIKYMCSPNVQERIALEIKAVPVNPETDLTQLQQENPLMYEMMATAQQAQIHLKDYQAMWYSSVYNASTNLYPKLVYGGLTPGQMADEMTRLAQEGQKNTNVGQENTNFGEND